MTGVPQFFIPGIEIDDAEYRARVQKAITRGVVAETFLTDTDVGKDLLDAYLEEAYESFMRFIRTPIADLSKDDWILARKMHERAHTLCRVIDTIGSVISTGKQARQMNE